MLLDTRKYSRIVFSEEQTVWSDFRGQAVLSRRSAERIFERSSCRATGSSIGFSQMRWRFSRFITERGHFRVSTDLWRN